MNSGALDPVILGPALLAGLLVLSTHVPLGRQVLQRGIIFIDLAVAQIAGLGVLAAHALGWESEGMALQATAFSAALLGALALYLCEKRWPESLEALIGTAFVLAASAGILLLAGNPHAGEHLRELLVGQILWVEMSQLSPVALLYALILPVWFVFRGARHPLLFYTLFALAVTASVQLVGVYLVFASLIIPALALRRRPRGSLLIAYAVGVCGYAAGLLAAALFDLPAGAMIVWMLAAFALLTSLLMKRAPAAGSA